MKNHKQRDDVTYPIHNLGVTFLTLLLTAAGTRGAGLVNGSFETPTNSAHIVEYGVAPEGFGWVIASGNIDVQTTGYWQCSDGNQSIDMNGGTPATIYQDFIFPHAGTWFIYFDFSANPDRFARGDGLATGLRTLQVDFGIPGVMTNLGTFSLDAAPRTINHMEWTRIVTTPIQALEGVVYRLQFSSLSPGIGGPALDNISIHQPPLASLRVSEVELCWPSEVGSIYRVQYRSQLTTNDWVDLLGTNVIGTGAKICIPDRIPVDEPQRFYQVLPTGP
jgi:hypothetical protein